MIGQPKRVAIVYDWATSGYGGAERVLEVLHELYPEATLFTALHDPAALWTKTWTIHTSFLQHIPWAASLKAVLAPLMPIAFESFDLSGFDLVISVSSAYAKGVRTSPQQLHVCYLLTPPRFVYTHTAVYLSQLKVARLPFVRSLLQHLIQLSKRWDQVAARRPDVIIPISQLVAGRAQSIYQLQCAKPIYPPVSLTPSPAPYSFARLLPASYDLVVSRLVTYKRINLAVAAALQLSRHLVVCGTGPVFNALKKQASGQALTRSPGESLTQFFARNQSHHAPRIYLVGNCSDEELSWLYQGAHTFLMPGTEDFGITGLEAVRHGVPVVLSGESGVAELLEEGVDAIYSREETVDAFSQAVSQRDTLVTTASTLQIRALQYDSEIFKKRFQNAIQSAWKEL